MDMSDWSGSAPVLVKLGLYPLSIISKWIRDPNTRQEALKLCKTHEDRGKGKSFLNRIQQHRKQAKKWKSRLHKAEKLLHNKESNQRCEEAASIMGKEVSANYITARVRTHNKQRVANFKQQKNVIQSRNWVMN